MNVPAYLLLTRVCCVVSGSLPAREVRPPPPLKNKVCQVNAVCQSRGGASWGQPDVPGAPTATQPCPKHLSGPRRHLGTGPCCHRQRKAGLRLGSPPAPRPCPQAGPCHHPHGLRFPGRVGRKLVVTHIGVALESSPPCRVSPCSWPHRPSPNHRSPAPQGPGGQAQTLSKRLLHCGVQRLRPARAPVQGGQGLAAGHSSHSYLLWQAVSHPPEGLALS